MTPLFAQPLDQWIAARKGQLLAAGGRYPGDDATDAELAAAARDASYPFWADPPEPVGEVTLEPFDKAALPPGVPWPDAATEPRRMVRATVAISGDASLLACAPLHRAPRGGWPVGYVAGNAAVVELPEPVRAEHLARVKAGVRDACARLAEELAVAWPLAGILLDEFRRRQGSNRERLAADKAARDRLSGLEAYGFVVK